MPADDLPPICGKPSTGTVLTKLSVVYSVNFFWLLMIPCRTNGINWGIQLNLIIFHNTPGVSIVYLGNYLSLFVIPYHISDHITSIKMANGILKTLTAFNVFILKTSFRCKCASPGLMPIQYCKCNSKMNSSKIHWVQYTKNTLIGIMDVSLCLLLIVLPNKIQEWLMLPDCHVVMVITGNGPFTNYMISGSKWSWVDNGIWVNEVHIKYYIKIT